MIPPIAYAVLGFGLLMAALKGEQKDDNSENTLGDIRGGADNGKSVKQQPVNASLAELGAKHELSQEEHKKEEPTQASSGGEPVTVAAANGVDSVGSSTPISETVGEVGNDSKS